MGMTLENTQRDICKELHQLNRTMSAILKTLQRINGAMMIREKDNSSCETEGSEREE